MNRGFHADSPNLKWCTDVSELKYGNGRKAYLSAIVDVYDNSIVSWVLSPSNNKKLVMDTVNKAYWRTHLQIATKASSILHMNTVYFSLSTVLLKVCLG
ncbi:DDE-type integrase/transposase/recombinase [Paenibacillus larvae]|nr:DDE-type integrase/transposase/recombinase [Paenibacillus larvae]MDT2274341.1 DDE-type integrase/transposase/recombinase [Paenibacillus larvae]